ncbi:MULTISPECIES: cytochrome-c oxidase, cbb3-type subunit III [Thiothrix]|mgnify:FL=1|jgi:cytochrome c oxidase cbb3-type subunit 3|uniref:Cbb3-type cytochrome c oxidase subunit n=2 Tax=Thiothrix TaxID=1030 RepID=A0A975F781_9GAMM|nr:MULTISPECIES: cytochrome-c oxidase, cbb3-type subunit III [Thiothrix]MDX9988617.1 cytochrome-c oxidase, cbb3-type subunit III [Thiothrix unzii]OQX14211.1 MAG: cytochrome-c oxidase, cbb3-type subunit III [Thiothrix lacustris]QTR52313.1 cytochrome-c oxidase, cbb3-type subunit III [Thiothrix unzii]
MATPVKDPLTGAETTGHVWDDTLQEFNNPLPRWWLWTFYGTIIFAITYWVMYPSWPIGKTYLKGVGNEITYKTDAGEEKSTHWNMRALLAHDMQNGEAALKQKEYLDKVGAASYEQIASDADMSSFVRSYGVGMFGDNCAACHQAGGQGVVGQFPNLVDDDWLWGGDTTTIETTIRNGRLGYMPAYSNVLDNTQLGQVANYVLSMSGETVDAAAAAEGQKIFQGETGGCYMCHTKEGKGLHAQGSANLTDKVWTIANLPAAETPEAKLEAVKAVIHNGVKRQMPVFGADGRNLSDTEIKVLTAYIKQMSSAAATQ